MTERPTLTPTRHIHHHIQINQHIRRIVLIDAKLELGPSPDIFSDIVEHEHEHDKHEKKSDETPAF